MYMGYLGQNKKMENESNSPHMHQLFLPTLLICWQNWLASVSYQQMHFPGTQWCSQVDKWDFLILKLIIVTVDPKLEDFLRFFEKPTKDKSLYYFLNH